MITFSVDPDRRIRTAHFTGTVGDDDLFAAYGTLLSTPGYDATLDDLVDLRDAGRLEVSSDALRRLITMFTPVDRLAVRTRLAFVAASDLTFGMSRMYELLRGDGVSEEIRVFRDHDEALAWLASPRELPAP